MFAASFPTFPPFLCCAVLRTLDQQHTLTRSSRRQGATGQRGWSSNLVFMKHFFTLFFFVVVLFLVFSLKQWQKYSKSDCPSHSVWFGPELLISGAILSGYSQQVSVLDNLLDLNGGAGHQWWNWYRNNRRSLAQKQPTQLDFRWMMRLQAQPNKKNATAIKQQWIPAETPAARLWTLCEQPRRHVDVGKLVANWTFRRPIFTFQYFCKLLPIWCFGAKRQICQTWI